MSDTTWQLNNNCVNCFRGSSLPWPICYPPHSIPVWNLVCLVTQSCPTLWDPLDCSPPGASVHGILHARILEWVAISFSRGSSWPRDRIQVSCIASGFCTLWVSREAQALTVNKTNCLFANSGLGGLESSTRALVSYCWVWLPVLHVMSCVNLATLTRHLNPQLLQLYKDYNRAYLKELLLELTEILYTSFLDQYPAQSKCSSILQFSRCAF